MDAIPLEEAQKQLDTLIAKASKYRQQYCIETPEGNAVLLSEEAYNDILITLEVLSTPGLMDTFRKGAMEQDIAEEA